VVALAEYLFGLIDKPTDAITDKEAEDIIALWNALPRYDQSPTKFKARHQTQLIAGRFKAPKASRTELIPGVQSVKR